MILTALTNWTIYRCSLRLHFNFVQLNDVVWISLLDLQFSDIRFSRGSVATRLRCAGIFNKPCYFSFPADCGSERIWKMCQYLMKLCMKILDSVFRHGVDV